MSYVIYETDTGRIRTIGECAPEFEGHQIGWEVNHGVLLGQALTPADWGLYYVDVSGPDPVVTPRAVNPATADKTQITADGVDAVTISNLPPDTVAVGSGGELPVPDGTLVMTCDTPMNFGVKCRSITHLSKAFQFEAVEP